MHRRLFLAAGAASLLAGATSKAFADQCAPTDSDIAGPFFRPRAPFRTTLLPGDFEGHGMMLGGVVRDSGCRPIHDAVLEIWQADPDGEYDHRGYRFRGRVRTSEDGRFAIHTAVPGRYRNGPTYRPAHIHFKIHANGRSSLTTQLYFPHDPYNDSDPWFSADRTIQWMPSGCMPGPGRARFDFTL